MNIGIFTNNYLPNPYGVTRSIESFCREFIKRGHSVYIFAPRFQGYIDENPNIFRYPSLEFNFKVRFPLVIPYSWKMRKIIKKLNLDVIHSQHPFLLGPTAMRWAKRKKIPLIFTWHTLYDHYTHFATFIPKKLATGYVIKKAVKYANQADAVIAPTESIIPILKKWGVEKELIPISSGVNEEEFINSDRNVIRKKYNIGDDEIVLLLVSRLTQEKNVEFVLRSASPLLCGTLLKVPHTPASPAGGLSRVQARGIKTKLLIVGGGDLKNQLESYAEKEGIENQVIFAGEIKRLEMKNYYAASDIFVYGSKSETQGMIITEAMYMGLPIVAVEATGSQSLVLNNGNGFLVEESEKEFAEAVERLIVDKDLRQKFSETSKRIAQMKFTASVCADKLLGVYEKAIRNHSK